MNTEIKKQLEQAIDKLRPCIPSADFEMAANQLLNMLREPISHDEFKEALKDICPKPKREDDRPYYRKSRMSAYRR